MKVSIISPEKVLFQGEAERVKLPGELSSFEVLKNHAPIVSTLVKGEVSCEGAQSFAVKIKSGFVEVARNEISVCVEL